MASPIRDHTVPWPSADADRYAAEGYWAGAPLGDLLRAAADRAPSALALVDGDSRFTYADLAGRADALAGRLLDLGLVPGDRIVIQLPNCWEFAVLTWACLRAGIVPVMALPAHRRNELSHLAAHSEAAAIAVPAVHRGFDHQELAHSLGSAWQVLVTGGSLTDGSVDLRALCGPPPDPAAARARLDAARSGSRDVAVFLLSGGTTGLPKLIARTHDDYAYNARASAVIADVGATSVYLVSLPAGHNFPLACPGILGTLLAGGTVVMLPSPEPAAAFAAIAADSVTHTAVVPAVAGRWLEHAITVGSSQLASLRVLQAGGARIADELARRVEPVLGARLQQVFGMAEGLLNYTRLDDPANVICGTQGRPLCPADEIRLVDDLDRDVPPGQPGSLLTRGPYTPRGYYRAPEVNERSFTSDGWYRSGDICRLTPEGNLIVEGRDKDMINRGGENVSAEEVENLLYRLPGVGEVAAVAMPDPGLGERVCVYVVPRESGSVPRESGSGALTLEGIRSALEELGVARYKFPERLVLVSELPATKVGKIDKKALREDIARRLSELRNGTRPPAGTVFRTFLCQEIAPVSGDKPIPVGGDRMDQQDQIAIDGLFRHLHQTSRQSGPRDPQAEALIQRHLQQAPPGVLYQMAQTLIAQQHIIQQMRARGGASAGLAQPGIAQPGFAQPGFVPGPGYQPNVRHGGGFLAGAGKVALGVGGGILGAEVLSSIFDGGGLFGGGEREREQEYQQGFDQGMAAGDRNDYGSPQGGFAPPQDGYVQQDAYVQQDGFGPQDGGFGDPGYGSGLDNQGFGDQGFGNQGQGFSGGGFGDQGQGQSFSGGGF